MSAVQKEYGDFVSQVYRRLRQLAMRECSSALREPIAYQLSTLDQSKGVRPALVLAANCANLHEIPAGQLIDRAAAIQALHEFTLIIDDVLDDGIMRRGRQALRVQYDPVIAGCVGAELEALAGQIFDDDPVMRREIRRFKRAVTTAEAIQQEERYSSRPFMIQRWQEIAEGDTGAILWLALKAGGLEAEGTKMGYSLAYLRHGLDDVEDLFDPDGDQADVRDQVPTLPTCFTANPTLSGLQQACGDALVWLNGYLTAHLTLGGEERFEKPMAPFFEDFADTWLALRDKVRAQA